MNVDKIKLANALERAPDTDSEKALVHESGAFYWGQCLKNISSLPPLNVTGVGAISVPITEQDLNEIKKATSSGAFSQPKVNAKTTAVDLRLNKPSLHNWPLENLTKLSFEPSSSCWLEKHFQYLGVLAINHMVGYNITDGVEVKMLLNQLTICTPGGQSVTLQDEYLENKKPGAFGKLILQIPVKGGYSGGKLMMEKNDQCYWHDLSHRSDLYFYCAAFIYTSGSNYKWQPVKHGCMATLDFDLVWRPPFMLATSISTPRFFKAAKDYKTIREALSVWNTLEQDELEDGEIFSEEEEITKSLMSLQSARKEIQSDVSTISVNDEDPALLVIPLEEEYNESSLSFSTLRGHDVKTVRLFQSIPFLDVHLAIVSQTLSEKSFVHATPRKWEVKGTNVPSNRSFKIIQWIYSEFSLPQIKNLKLDMAKQLVGDIKTILSWTGSQDQLIYCHPVLIIQPRQDSIRRCGFQDFDCLLNHLESKLDYAEDSKFRLKCLNCLSQVIGFCKAEPLAIWDVSPVKAATRTQRLLRICESLRARKEGQNLIDLLCKNFEKDSSLFYEGVRSELVARSIVDMLWNAGGWHIFAGPVLRLITPNRLLSQLKNFCTIVVCLLEYRCIQGAHSVVHRIFSTMTSNFELVEKLNQPHIDAYVKAMVAFEVHPDSASVGPILSELVFPIFTKMSPYQQYRLLIDFQDTYRPRFKEIPPCLQLYKSMSLHILETGLSTAGLVPEVIRGLVYNFLEQDDEKLRDIFIEHILFRPNSKDIKTNNSIWLDELINICTSTAHKVSFYRVLNNKTATIVHSTSRGLTAEIDMESQRNEWVDFLLVLLRVERVPALADPQRFVSLSSVYRFLSTDLLNDIVVDLIERGTLRLKNHPSGQTLFMEIGNMLLQRDRIDDFLPIQSIFDILKCFLCLPELSMAQLFLLDIYRCNKWRPRDKNLLISTILSSPEIWSKLVENEAKMDFVQSSITTLLSTWITGIILVMDQPDSEEKDRSIRSNIIDCFLVYIRDQKKNQNLCTKQVAIKNGIFPPLIAKMSVKNLGNLIWDIYQSDLKELPSLKKFTKLINLYRELCRRFVARDLKSLLKSTSNMIIKVTQCLLWLGDGQSILLFSNKILATYPAEETNLVMLKLANSSEIRQLAESMSLARVALCRLVEHRLKTVTEVLQKEAEALAWRMPNVSLPSHPVVQEFLRSNAKQMTYANFSNINQAAEFSSQLTSLCPDNGYSVTVNLLGEDFNSRCEIAKLQLSNDETTIVEGSTRDEKAKLVALLNSLKLQQHSNCSVNESGGESGGEYVVDDDEVIVLINPAKRVKNDVRLVELLD